MKNSNFNYQVDIPMPLKERHFRQIKVEVSRMLIECKSVSKQVGYLEIPEDLIKKTFDVFCGTDGVVILPLGLHMTYKEFIQANKATKSLETVLFKKLDGFSAKCSTIDSFIDFFRFIKCETVAILPCAAKYSYETLFSELLSAVETNQYDLILTKHLNNYEAYGFLSLDHQNLEIIGHAAKIKEIYSKDEFRT